MNNILKNDFPEIIYLVVPVINGNINGYAYITLSLDNYFDEVLIYEINLNTFKVREVRQ